MTQYLRAILLFLFATLVAQAQSKSTDLQDLLNRYRQARAEPSAYLNIRSIAIIGETTQGDEKLSFELNQRDTGEIRYTVTSKGRTLVQVFDGKEGWQWVSGQPERGVRRLTPAQLRFFRMNASFYTPLERLYLYDFDLKYLGLEVNQQGSPEYHIELRSTRIGDVLDIWIDGVNFRENRRAYRPAENESPLITTFADYRKVDGIYVPFSTVSTFQGNLLSNSIITKVERNTGMLSFYFTKPTGYPELPDNQVQSVAVKEGN